LPLSGDLPQAQRTRTLDAFRNGSVEILVATDVAARGIDVPNIATVIQIDTPFDAKTYVHRSGRTGRAGREGRSLMLIPGSQERRMRRLLSSAGITAQWQPPPGPEQIRKAARKQQRRELWERLESENGHSEQQLDYAASLLEEHDPKAVVAALLDLATRALPCEPKQVAAVASGATTKRQKRDKRDQDFVAFSISWGARKGATTSRVLSQVCRRGGVSGQLIGAIRVEPGHSTFQIARKVADAFEAKASQPDDRDPGVRIERMDDTDHAQRRRQAHSARIKPSSKPSRHQRPGRPKGYGKGRPRRKAVSR